VYGIGVTGAIGAAITLGTSGFVVGGVVGVVSGIVIVGKKYNKKVVAKNNMKKIYFSKSIIN
jgi:Na+/glutamate symporter